MKQIYNPETKLWEEGKAAPELIAPHLRELPADYVTKDIADDKRVHEYDDRHIVDDLVGDRQKAETETGEPDALAEAANLSRAEIGHPCPLSQLEIDVVRFRVLSSMVTQHLRAMQNDPGYDPDFAVRHLWFPENDVNHYELREGNPPAVRDRPKHLRSYELELDLARWPRRLADELRVRGVRLPPELGGTL
jgi:hypothetical protein